MLSLKPQLVHVYVYMITLTTIIIFLIVRRVQISNKSTKNNGATQHTQIAQLHNGDLEAVHIDKAELSESFEWSMIR